MKAGLEAQEQGLPAIDRLPSLHVITSKPVTLPLHEVCDFQTLFLSRLQLGIGGPWQEQCVVCQVVIPIHNVPQVCVRLHSNSEGVQVYNRALPCLFDGYVCGADMLTSHTVWGS